MGDSNSRHLAPKASALPTALIPDFWLLSFAPDVVKHVVRRFFWPSRLAGEVPVSQAYQGIADTVFSSSKGERPAPKPGAIPTSLYPDVLYYYNRSKCACPVLYIAFCIFAFYGILRSKRHWVRLAQIKSAMLESGLFRPFVIALECTLYKGMPLLYSHLHQRIQR